MAKDYIQDIVPPDGDDRIPPRRPPKRLNVTPPKESVVEDDADDLDVGLPNRPSPEDVSSASQTRSIRDIAPSRTRIKMSSEAREPFSDDSGNERLRPARRWGLWAAAAIGIIVIGVFALFSFRDTTITVTPQVQSMTFDSTSHFTAYPDTTAASGTLPYKIISSDLDDSEPVEAQGLQHVETKASGSITVSNSYSSSVVRLVKNTRFQSADGKIFRTPADVIVPGSKGSTPGSVNVLVVADQSGDSYNEAPTSFTLPGLQSNAAMYKGVTAKSSTAFTGGFAGDQPAVAPATLTATISAVRARLAATALQSAKSNNDYVLFPDLSQISYQDMPSTVEAGGGVRIHEKAHVDMVAFPKTSFTQAIGKSVSADAENASITLRPGTGFAAHTSLPAANWGIQPMDFVLAGQAQLIWNLDTDALARALAGRDDSAFQTIITGFPAIKEAHARIQPFWKSTFPNPSKIKVTVVEPSTTQ